MPKLRPRIRGDLVDIAYMSSAPDCGVVVPKVRTAMATGSTKHLMEDVRELTVPSKAEDCGYLIPKKKHVVHTGLRDVIRPVDFGGILPYDLFSGKYDNIRKDPISEHILKNHISKYESKLNELKKERLEKVWDIREDSLGNKNSYNFDKIKTKTKIPEFTDKEFANLMEFYKSFRDRKKKNDHDPAYA